MSRIETGLHALHAATKDGPSTFPSGISTANVVRRNDEATAQSSLTEALFATVNSVVAGSPADTAGLKAGDAIRRFGAINWLNHEKLSKLAETVQRNEGVSLGRCLNLSAILTS